METRLSDLAKRFQGLELEAMKAGEIEARAKIEKARNAISEKRDAVEGKLRAAKKAGDGAFVEAREGVISAWTELSDAFERAREELEGVTA